MQLRGNNRSYGEASFHIVFCPKYRFGMFGIEELKEECERAFEEIAEQWKFEIRALRVMEEHIHLFLAMLPKYSVSQTVKYFKGASARRLFEEYSIIKEVLWGGHFWSRGYFYRSVGSTTDEAVEFYIKLSQDKQQREKYYTAVGTTKKKHVTSEDPYLEYVKGNLKFRLRTISKNQATLDSFLSEAN